MGRGLIFGEHSDSPEAKHGSESPRSAPLFSLPEATKQLGSKGILPSDNEVSGKTRTKTVTHCFCETHGTCGELSGCGIYFEWFFLTQRC